MMTDLEGSTVARALNGIHAELLRREQICNDWAVADVSDLPDDVACPRLMVVIDEAAWLLSNYPEFSSVLSDVLARGRSLGVHVVISTQRIAGVLTPSMMANVSLRMCGRVTDDSEVAAWMPDISSTLRTRARHFTPGSLLMQGAQQGPHVREVREIAVDGTGGEPSAWRVWADPLPSTFSADRTSWGLLDDLPHATHRALTWEECPSGSVLVVGDRGMGRTSAHYCALASF
jgi:S-DNA-T family DNA segregation ATPase FtsK/SpoIIIE